MNGSRSRSMLLGRFARFVAALLMLATASGLGAMPARAQSSNCPTAKPGNVDQKTAVPFPAAGCVIVPNDPPTQAIFTWTVSADDAATLWSFSATGVAGSAELISIYQDPGDPTVTPNKLAEFDAPNPGDGVASPPLLLAPGNYFVAGAAALAGPFTLSVAKAGALPGEGEKEPNDSSDQAQPLKSAFAFSGDLQNSEDWYSWKLSKQDAAKHWTLSLLAPLGDSPTLQLQDASGNQLASISTDASGRAVLSDLGLDAGTYLIHLSPAADHSVRYALQAAAGSDRSPDTENEPNDTAALANHWDLANPIYGHIANASDMDFFTFHVDATLAASLFDLTVMASPGLDRKICLLDSDGADISCKDNTSGLVALSGLSLTEGDHTIRIAGDPSPSDEYSIDLLVTGKVEPGQESLPNDSVKSANPLNASNSIKGAFAAGNGERHVFKLHTEGDPQLWRIEAVGGGIQSFRLLDASETTLFEGSVSSDGSYAVMRDQYFTPGDHWLAIAGAGGAFSISATPAGAPDPNGEREPNNDLANSEILKMGVLRTGRLVDQNDTDVYRFSLAADEHVVIKVQSPAGGRVHATLQWSGTTIQTSDVNADGALAMLDLKLKAGDYAIFLTAAKPSESKYQISFDRADPFLFAVDQEPNNSFAEANPLPPTLQLTGYVGQFNDNDWYQLPVQTQDAKLEVKISSPQIAVRIKDAAGNDIAVTTAVNYLSAEATLPANTQTALQISGGGPYTVGLAFTPGPAPVAEGKPSVAVHLVLDTNQVAAYWSQGQTIRGAVTLTNAGFLPQTVQLAAITSHYAWTLALDQTTVVVPPGGAGIAVPATLSIQPDAWANVPVRMTVAATGKYGAITTSYVEIDPSADAAPANPALAWPIPQALLGGLDVASLALGAEVIPSVDQAAEEQLHDGLASVGGGFHLSSATLPLTLTVQLAGDQPVPVAGFILNPLNSEAPPTWVRHFKILLSTDGATYAEALSGELQPLPIEQNFVLPAPVAARYAQLVILSNDDPDFSSTSVSLGEWKVIASPGFSPLTTLFNLADPVNGGHVVTMNPQFDLQTDVQSIIDPGTESKTLSLKAGVKPSWIIGFSEERAAEIASLGWIDPTGSDPTIRFTKVTVEVSVAGPFGPWTKIGVWSLDRAADGTVAPLTLDKPVWARFIRFTGNGPKADSSWEFPAQIEVMERATDKDYQSILGQWGYGNPMGPHELINPPAPATLPASQGNTSKETAAPLAPNAKASGRVQIGQQTAWYTVVAPPGQNTLTFTVGGDPVADAVVHLFDATGVEVATTLKPASAANVATYVASVQPGQTYTVKMVQPPHSVAFAFDTSASIGNYETMVRQALRAFAADVTPGQEYVNIMPFSSQFLLKTWSDQPYQIESALSDYTDDSGSSSVEETLINAIGDMSGRDGAKAILLVTDGETSSYPLTSQLWPNLATVQPRIFSVHVGSGGDGGVSRHLMQDLSAAANGVYQYTETQGEMDRAFDRLATIMRRPVGFTISFAASQEKVSTPTPAPTATPINQKPGTLQVSLPAESGNQPAAAVSTDVAVEIILDTSGSMLQELEPGKSRIDVARETLVNLVSAKLPPGIPVALRTFADDPGSCDTILRSPLGPLDPGAMASTIQNVGVTNLVKTPIGAALDQVAVDLASVKGPKIVVLVTDGEETCGGDPAASIKRLAANGFDVQVNIVGFALDDAQLKATFKNWAQLGHGSYFDASNSAELNSAVDKALAPPFQVFDATGKQVASGRAGGDAISLPPGTYKVVVLSNPTRTFKTVVINSGKKTKLNFADGDAG